MEISINKIKELRQKVGVGIMDCKNALKEANGDLKKAIDFLKKKGITIAMERSSKTIKEGGIFSYIHMQGRIGVLVEINCETDFVAKTDDFKQLLKDIAMQVAATNPIYVNSKDIPEEIIEHEKSIFKEQLKREGKSEAIWDKILPGKMQKYFEDVCLIEQKFIKDQNLTIKILVNNLITKTGENIKIRRFVRFKLGEDLDSIK